MKCNRRVFIGGALATGARAASPKPRRVVLVHGLLGFDKVGHLSYFNGVRQWFDSGCQFIEPQLDPAGAIEERGLALQKAIQSCVPSADLSRGKAIHPVAHSMGGLDVRYLVSSKGLNCGSWVASITTISTPNAGSAIADIVTRKRSATVEELAPLATLLTPDHWRKFFASLKRPSFDPALLLLPTSNTREQLAGYLAAAFGSPVEAFQNLTTSYAVEFNRMYPDFGTVPMQSYAGVSTPSNTMVPLLYLSWAILKSRFGDNDGLVPVSSSQWAGLATRISADHIEEVGLAPYVDLSLGSQMHFPIEKLYVPINRWQASMTGIAPSSTLQGGCSS
jgi:triacylglycerol lipase